jgi:hypothetical protein
MFSDDFSGAAGVKPDASKWSEWSACTYNGSAAYGSIKCGERATLDGQGHLVIPATPTQGTSISTKDHFRASTGTFAARMKVSSVPGYWPAFWMVNANPNGADRKPTVGEVDVHESYTGLANGYRRAVHNYYPTDTSKSWSGLEDPLCGQGATFDQWHDYSAKVETNKITFYFDGQMCGSPVLRSENPKPWAFAPDNTWGLWPILTLAVGGAGGQQDGKAVNPATLLVDYVRVTR